MVSTTQSVSKTKALTRGRWDLREYSAYVESYKLLSYSPPDPGNYWEPASPPEAEFEVNEIVIESASSLPAEMELTRGDLIRVTFLLSTGLDDSEWIASKARRKGSRTPTDDPDIYVDDWIEVEGTEHVEQTDELIIECNYVKSWQGQKPSQSFRGWGKF